MVVPCYRQARLLADALDSIAAQTHPAVEAVVVDDGSPDDVAGAVTGRPGVKLLRQRNSGLVAARNAGFRTSNGSFVIFLDADDRLTPNAIASHLRCFDAHPACGFVVGDIDHIDADGSYAGSPRWPLLESAQYEALLRVDHVANTIAVMFRRAVVEALGGFDSTWPAAADYEILLRAARSFASAHHRDVVAQYRRHGASMSRNGARMLAATLDVLRAQRPWVAGDARLETALRAGERAWRQVYGEALIDELHAYAHQREWTRATRALAALARYYPARLLHFAASPLRAVRTLARRRRPAPTH